MTNSHGCYQSGEKSENRK